jgi:hypothetical protein
VKVNFTNNKVKANLALGAGTYMNANYVSEPVVFKNILEANAGIRVGKKNLWIDVGILPSHIGFESAVSKDCWNLTRSLLADNSPYFEAGARITYTSGNDKWLLCGIALNGWQRITRVKGNSLMSWGTQVRFKSSDKILLNYSAFIGTDKPDSARLNRVFHNFYGIFTVTKQFGITAGFDIGTEEKFPGSNNKNTWYSPVLIFRFLFNEKWVMAARWEYYSDQNEVIMATGTQHGFRSTGISLNIDHSPVKSVLLRVEARNLSSKDRIFTNGITATKSSASVTSSIAVSF